MKQVGNCPRCGNPIYEESTRREGTTAVEEGYDVAVHRTCQCLFETVPYVTIKENQTGGTVCSPYITEWTVS